MCDCRGYYCRCYCHYCCYYATTVVNPVNNVVSGRLLPLLLLLKTLLLCYNRCYRYCCYFCCYAHYAVLAGCTTTTTTTTNAAAAATVGATVGTTLAAVPVATVPSLQLISHVTSVTFRPLPNLNICHCLTLQPTPLFNFVSHTEAEGQTPLLNQEAFDPNYAICDITGLEISNNIYSLGNIVS